MVEGKAFLLGCANLISVVLVEDFAWFVNKWLVQLQDDPKAGQLMQFTDWTYIHLGINRLVIPKWYLVAIALATIADTATIIVLLSECQYKG
ncbi:MAG: hypothetical protein ACJ71J_00940 [Nitrososphaeraceae archaeon]